MEHAPNTSTASVAPKAALDPLSTLLSQTWQWFNAHFPNLLRISGIFLGIQFVLGVLLALFGVLTLATTFTSEPTGASLVSLIVGVVILAIVFGFISLWNTLALYTYIIRNDKQYSARQAISDSRAMILPYLGTSLIVGLLVLLGTLLLIVPGIYLAVLFGFAPLITLVEGKNVRALSRSKFLVKGHWWPVFLRQIVVSLIVYILSVIINTIFTTLFDALSSIYEPLSLLGGIGDFFSNILFAPVSLIFSFLLYQNLRRMKG